MTGADLEARDDGGETADAVAAAALALPCVVRLAADGPAQVATYLPGRRVAGVAVREDVCEVAVVLQLQDRPLPELADEVRRAVVPHVGSRAVDVVIADVVLPEQDPDEEPGGG